VPPQAESAEGRGLTQENTSQSLLDRTQRRNADGRPFANCKELRPLFDVDAYGEHVAVRWVRLSFWANSIRLGSTPVAADKIGLAVTDS
jgi:hypothetical protein